jgi:hypothetical protein
VLIPPSLRPANISVRNNQGGAQGRLTSEDRPVSRYNATPASLRPLLTRAQSC